MRDDETASIEEERCECELKGGSHSMAEQPERSKRSTVIVLANLQHRQKTRLQRREMLKFRR